MLRFNRHTSDLLILPESTMAQRGILERAELQPLIVKNFTSFFHEMREDLLFIGQAVRPTEGYGDEIDILAIDKTGAAVIIELKRGNDPRQMLQAINYAGMVSNWNRDNFSEQLARSKNISDDEAVSSIEQFIEGGPQQLNSSQRIILIADGYDVSLLSGAEWLYEQFEVDIRCVRVNVAHDGDREYLLVNRIFPLAALLDVAAPRRANRVNVERPIRTWDEAIENVENDAQREFFRTYIAEGAENSLNSKELYFRVQNTRRFSVGLRSEHSYVWQTGRFLGDVAFWRERLSRPEDVQVVAQERHIRFRLSSQLDFESFRVAVTGELQQFIFQNAQNAG